MIYDKRKRPRVAGRSRFLSEGRDGTKLQGGPKMAQTIVYVERLNFVKY